MLENLTKKLIEDDWAKHNKEILFEGAVVASNMPQIERYSHIDTDVEYESIKTALENVNLNESTMSFEDGCEALYEACVNPSVISEAVENVEADGVKRLTMTKADYDKISNHVKDYVAADTPEKKFPYKRKMKSFVGTINANIAKADEVDTFIASAIRKIYNALRSDRPLGGNTKAVVMSNIRGIKDAL